MRDYDLFWAAQGSPIEHSLFSRALGANVTIAAGRNLVTLLTAPTNAVTAGQLVFLRDNDNSRTAYMRVTRVVSTTQLELEWIRTTQGSDPTGLTYTTASAKVDCAASASLFAASLVIDLSDAPPGVYAYAIVGQATLTTSATNGQVNVSLRSAALLDDPFSGGQRSASFFTLPNSGGAHTDSGNYVGSAIVSLTAGQRYEFHLEFSGVAYGQITRAIDPRLVAMRYTPGTSYVAGDGATVETSNVNVTPVDHLTLTAVPAGTYLLLATSVSRDTSVGAGEGVSVSVKNTTAGTTLSSSLIYPANGADYYPTGAFRVVTTTVTSNFSMSLTDSGAGTSYVKHGVLALLKPLAFATMQGQLQDSTTTYVPAGSTAFSTAVTSSTPTLTAGKYIEAINAELGSAARFEARPQWGAPGHPDPNGRGLHGLPAGTPNTYLWATFFLDRVDRPAGVATANSIGVRSVAGATNVAINDAGFAWLAESPTVVPAPDAEISIIADVETGLLIRTFDSISGAYRKRLPDVADVSRVVVNGADLVEKVSFAALANDSFYWDAVDHAIWLKLAGAADPGDQAKVSVIVEPIRVGRSHADLLDSSGVSVPYDSRLLTPPGISEAVESSGGKYGSSTSLGSVDLIGADGAFDDLIVQRQWEGLRCRVRRGVGVTSGELADYRTISHGVLGLPGMAPTGVSAMLFDAGLILTRPISGLAETITIEEGSPDNYKQRIEQLVPLVYGKVKRLSAFRITHALGSTATNTFQFAPSAAACKLVLAAYLEATSTTAISTALVTDGAALCGVIVKNSAFTPAGEAYADSQVGDTVYVDLEGRKDYTSGQYFSTPGAIARHLLVTHGGVAAGDLVEASFRLADRVWRQQRAANTILPIAPEIAYLIEPTSTVADALTQICEGAFLYWRITPEGRIALDIPDLDAGQLLGNPGFESSSTTIYPWRKASTATASITSARNYDGVYAVELSNGGSPATDARLEQDVMLPRPGQVVVTFVASLMSGTGGLLRVGFVSPSGVEVLSDATAVTSGRWSRVTHVVDVPIGEAGLATVRIYPAQGSTAAATVAIDNVELYMIAGVADADNSNFIGMALQGEIYFKAAVTYDVDLEDRDRASKGAITDVEARFLTGATSEAQYLIASSGRIDLDEVLAKDLPSALAVAAPIAQHYGRQRQRMSIVMLGLDPLPKVGDRVVHRNHRRIPEAVDGYAVWRAVKVDYTSPQAQTVALELERQSDPVIDRTEIAPDSIPIGAIGLAVVSGTVTDFSELTEMQGYYAAMHAFPSLTTVQGSATHTHSLDHTHALASHNHTLTPTSLSGAVAGPTDQAGWPDQWLVSMTGYFVGTDFLGPNPANYQERLMILAAHSHPLSAATTTALATGTAIAGSITSATASSDVDHIRVRFMQRTAANAATIAQTMVVGFESSSIPAGWQRVTAIDGRAIRGATAVAGETVGVQTAVANHDHGAAIPAHTHSSGHAHGNSPELLMPAVESAAETASCWSTTDVNYAFQPRVPLGTSHYHFFRGGLESDATASSSAAGSVAALKAVMPQLGLVWIQPSDALQTYLPAGTIMLWSASGNAPTGWVFVDSYGNLLLGGAATGAGVSTLTAGHSHSITPAAHTLSHAHSGSLQAYTSGPNASYGFTSISKLTTNPWTPDSSAATTTLASDSARQQSAGGYEAAIDGHSHLVTSTVGTTAPALAAGSATSGLSGSAKPLHKRLRLIKKL